MATNERDQSEIETDDRTTRELIETLGEDVTRCHSEIIKAIDAGTVDENGDVTADYLFHARQLVRAFFAYVEGVTFSVKVHTVDFCQRNGIDTNPQEAFFAAEVDHKIDEKGQVVEQRAQINLTLNLRFAFTLLEKAYGTPPKFDPGVEWWSCLKKSIKVRDRLMHPKFPGDLDVSGDEIIDVLKAKQGFEELLLGYRPRKCRRLAPSHRK
jgi:hypothetical protein